MALHVNRLYPDYLTGVKGLREAIEPRGLYAIPTEHKKLFPVAFDNLSGFPPSLLMHGKNDGAVPFALSEQTAKKLMTAGVRTETDFPEDAHHGFDGMSGIKDLDAEDEEEKFKTPAIQS
jgi:acetyl esterase/lipase